MSVNPDNDDEFVISNFSIGAGEFVSFYNNVHVSNYKVTLDESINNKLASARKTIVTVNVGGLYNVYINKKLTSCALICSIPTRLHIVAFITTVRILSRYSLTNQTFLTFSVKE